MVIFFLLPLKTVSHSRYQLYDLTISAQAIRVSYQVQAQLIQTCQCGKIKHCFWNTSLLYTAVISRKLLKFSVFLMD